MPARLFVTRKLPWLLAALALALYLVTGSRWVTTASLFPVIQASGWDWSLPMGHPFVYLVGKGLRLVAGANFPLAANLFTAFLGASCVWMLARVVALLPHNRTISQRVRERSEIGLLTLPLAWVPPVLAVVVFAFALTVWQHATAFTGEMIDLTVFAYCVMCVAEFRLDRSEARLYRMAFVYGCGMANNPALVAYGPVMLGALGWTMGFSFFRPKFLLPLFAFGLLGTCLILVMPVVAVSGHRYEQGFWELVGVEFSGIKDALVGSPRGRISMFAVIMLLPLGVIAVKWQPFADKTIEALVTQFIFHLAQIAWLGGCMWVMLDGRFSPRRIVISPSLLTFYFTGAVAVGYFAGYYLLVAFSKPKELPRGEFPFLTQISQLVSVGILAACIGIPALNWVWNGPIQKAESGGPLRELGDAIYADLPSQPAMILADDPVGYYIALVRSKSQPDGPVHLILNTQFAPSEKYRQFLFESYGKYWPAIAKPTQATQNVAGEWVVMASTMADTNRLFYVNPTIGIFNERLDFHPTGVTFKGSIAKELIPAPISPGECDKLSAYWKAKANVVADVRKAMDAGATNLSFIASTWSKLQNASGVALQQAGRLAEARDLFRQSTNVYPANAAAQVNLAVNECLMKKTPFPADVDKPLENQPGLLDRYGPVDEPVFLYYFAQSILRQQDELSRRAVVALKRAADLAPADRMIHLGLADSYLSIGRLPDTTNILQAMHMQSEGGNWTASERSEWYRVSAAVAAQLNDLPGAEVDLLAARSADPKSERIHDALSYLYLVQGKIDKSLAAVDQWEKAVQSSSGAPARRALVMMRQKKYDEALRALDRVLELSADNDIARLNRAICNLALNHFAEAKRDYLQLMKRRDTFQVRFGLAAIARMQSEKKDELEHLARYLEMAPKSTAEYTNAEVRLAELKSGR
ncbi:MAG TPA: tetratricopeptide repeat protein [Candidatus Limnocylindria bacterium]|jgi:tetratricopeptide (TPR) repeat protein|nr:tetratricopeptide repeat protein [Candidatus Limnocylindria bacterium]